MAGALKSLAFLERYRSDLKTKQQRAKALEKKWINQTLGAQYLPGAKEKEDITQAVQVRGRGDTTSGHVARGTVDPFALCEVWTGA